MYLEPGFNFYYIFQQNFNLKVILPGLKEDSQILKIRLLPGNTIFKKYSEHF
jgi:hypothetical protein